MKQCPQCKTTYTDQSLLFCLADGTPLVALEDEQQTFVRPAAGAAMRVEIPQEVPLPQYSGQSPNQAGGSNTLKIVAVFGAIGLMALIAVVGAGALIYFNRDARTAQTNSTANTPPKNTATSPLPSPTPDETGDLKNKIANLERKINDQKNANRTANNSAPPSSGTTARVNSPGDGFLALRSLPNSDTGFRVATIPHGTTISVSGCLSPTRIGNRNGRWCRASYGGYSGWVFDAWLVY